MSDTATTGEITKTEFAATLIDLDKGRVHDDAGDGLAEVVAAVARTGLKGKLTLTIEVEPLDRDSFEDDGTLTVTGSIKVDAPRFKRAPSVFYVKGRKGQMTREAPRSDGF